MRTAAAAIAALAFAPLAGASGRDHAAAVTVRGGATYVVRQGDSLHTISARFGVDVTPLTAANGVRADGRLDVGQRLRIDNRHIVPPAFASGVLVINIPQRMLFYADDDGYPDAMPVAVGRRGWATPVGPFTVSSREAQPTWDVPSSILAEARRAGRSLPERVPPGPQNPLGAFWIGLSIPGVGMHGTNAPGSIYRAATHGCIRLHPDDIARLFSRVRVGTAGRIIYEPVLLAAADAAVLLEVHGDVYGRLTAGALQRARALADAAGLTDRIDWTIAEAVVAARHGVARVVTKQEAASR